MWRAFEVTGDHNYSTEHHTDVVFVFGFFRSQARLFLFMHGLAAKKQTGETNFNRNKCT